MVNVSSAEEDTQGIFIYQLSQYSVYGCIDITLTHVSTCSAPVHHTCRSRMNTHLRISSTDGAVDEKLEKEFIDEAAKKGMIQLKGHR